MSNHGVWNRVRGIALTSSLLGTAMLFGGCRTDAGTGAAVGAGAGAGLGAIIGHQSGHGGEGAAIGAGAGALLGYIIGNESDKHKDDRRCDPRYDY
jgi:uncharacterized protein YcfJ